VAGFELIISGRFWVIAKDVCDTLHMWEWDNCVVRLPGTPARQCQSGKYLDRNHVDTVQVLCSPIADIWLGDTSPA
jgi:hypothetical protein